MSKYLWHPVHDRETRASESDEQREARLHVGAKEGVWSIKEMLISFVMPIMSLYKLPYVQYGYSGHVLVVVVGPCF